ncbi:hypothetical protein IU436_29790 [Nocardia farcinica]|uniref:hypothetical protein n=1 Tax=Nocardia farcinica TaxID=37329 RepID=UPI001895BAF1|nr:hypothetical protein [Nocardia farcinica]MBF6434513.1 hypothetical protein [Nocardia farcinica]MBF6505598.1 hypothetical protein [Nocardia farcinica]
MTTLRELLQRAADRGLSTRAMEARVERAASSSGKDMQLNRSTASLIMSGKYKSKPSDPTIRAIAFPAEVEESVAFAAAEQPTAGSLAFRDEIPAEADKLSAKRRRVALDVIRSLIEAEEFEHRIRHFGEQAGVEPQDLEASRPRVRD